MTKAEAEKRGWTFETESDLVVIATHEGGQSIRAISDDPLTAALAQVGIIENGEPQPDPVATALATTRLYMAARIQAALAASDIWAARHVEDGVSLTPERIKYRQALRKLLASVEASDDPQGINIPDPPPPPTS